MNQYLFHCKFHGVKWTNPVEAMTDDEAYIKACESKIVDRVEDQGGRQIYPVLKQ